MTTTIERPQRQTISRIEPEPDVSVFDFYIKGDGETRPGVTVHSSDASVEIIDNGETWHDDREDGHEIVLVVSDEPGSYPTRVLVNAGLATDWVLEEAIRTLAEVRARRAAMLATGVGQ